MVCAICKTGHYRVGFTTVVLAKGESAVILKQVPARVCDQCGEYILSSEVTRQVLAIARDAYSSGTELVIRRFVDMKISAEGLTVSRS